MLGTLSFAQHDFLVFLLLLLLLLNVLRATLFFLSSELGILYVRCRKVAVHPKGNSSTAKGRFVSIFVECVAAKSFAPYQKVKAEVFIRIKHKLDNVHHTRTCKDFRCFVVKIIPYIVRGNPLL